MSSPKRMWVLLQGSSEGWYIYRNPAAFYSYAEAKEALRRSRGLGGNTLRYRLVGYRLNPGQLKKKRSVR